MPDTLPYLRCSILAQCLCALSQQFFLKFSWNKVVLGKIDCCAMFGCNNDHHFQEIYGERP